MDLSFTSFWGQLAGNPILIITVVFTLGVIFVNGWTDAPNAIATCVTTRCLGVRQAIWMSAVFNFLGVFVMTQINSSVASTISNMVDFGTDTSSALIALCASLLSIVVYSVGASIFGIPTSESHSLIAGLSGAAQGGVGGINFGEWSKVLYGLALSLLLGFATGWVICKLVTILCYNIELQAANRFFRLAQIAGAELHARRPGWSEVHRRFVPGAGLFQRPELGGGDGNPGLADAAVQRGHGPGHQRRR